MTCRLLVCGHGSLGAANPESAGCLQCVNPECSLAVHYAGPRRITSPSSPYLLVQERRPEGIAGDLRGKHASACPPRILLASRTVPGSFQNRRAGRCNRNSACEFPQALCLPHRVPEPSCVLDGRSFRTQAAAEPPSGCALLPCGRSWGTKFALL